MKKLIAVLVAMMMLLGAGQSVLAEEETHITVGSVTPFTGAFATKMWGNVESDNDVRYLVHGYDTVEWRASEATFAIDRSVVSGFIARQLANGDVSYTLTFCNDLYYNDGSRITARDYAFSYLLSIAPEVDAIGGTPVSMEYVKGYADYAAGKTKYLPGIRLLSEDTISITIARDYLPFFYELGLLECMPYPISVIAPGCRIADDGQGVYITNEDPLVKEPVFTAELLADTLLDPETGYLTHPKVSSGPYSFVSYDGEKVELEVNPLYKGNSSGKRPSIDRITFRTVANGEIRQLLENGEIDLVNKVVSADVLREILPLADGSAALTTSLYKRTGMSFISFCCEKTPLDRVLVRRAIAMCLDKDALVDDTVGSYGQRVDGYYGMGQWMYQLVNGDLAYPVAPLAEDASDREKQAYRTDMAAWQALNMQTVPKYAFNVSEAERLLQHDGWAYNPEGGRYAAGKDTVRCKRINGELVPLRFTILCPEGSSITEHLQADFVDHLAKIGIEATVETAPMAELLRSYYRYEERAADMYVLATNFDLVFDPSVTFRPDGKDRINRWNPTGLSDEKLFEYAEEMRATEPGDTLGYCRRWLKFERRFQELVPMIPIYSNLYYDVYGTDLKEYDIVSNVTWSQAITAARLEPAQEG